MFFFYWFYLYSSVWLHQVPAVAHRVFSLDCGTQGLVVANLADPDVEPGSPPLRALSTGPPSEVPG